MKLIVGVSAKSATWHLTWRLGQVLALIGALAPIATPPIKYSGADGKDEDFAQSPDEKLNQPEAEQEQGHAERRQKKGGLGLPLCCKTVNA
jgi:hypothetical protein